MPQYGVQAHARVWWQQREYGFFYWLENFSDTHGAHLVSTFVDRYRSLGWQCGFLGAPITDEYVYYPSGYRVQYFQGGRLDCYC